MTRTAQNIFHLIPDSLVLIGAVLGTVFWLIESAMHMFVFHRFDFVESIFYPGLHETWMRLVIVGMFVSFGLYAQRLVNARRKAQESLALANTELTQIFETSADGMRIIDRDFNMLRANATFCSLAGVKNEDTAGKKCHEVFSGPLCHTASCTLLRILNGEDRVDCDTEKIQRSGRAVPCIVTATPFRAPDGELIGIVEDFKDISDRKHNEEELRQSRRRLRELTSYIESAREEERTRIAREIHDELGQSLTALKMELHWCIQRLPPDDPPLIEKAASLLGLIDENVHFVQRISSELRPGLLDTLGLSAAIEWQVGQFQDRTGIDCELLCEPDDILLDPTRSTAIFRVFQESLTNIARHARATKVKITLKDDPCQTELVVRDNGRGITEAEISDPRSFGLMGIRERVHVLGGSVEIAGIPNQGTTIKIRVPPKEGARRPVLKILIADDHAIVREGLKQILSGIPDIAIAGEASDGHQALERIRSGDYDPVLLDIAMPGMNGLDVLKQLRIERADLPVLMLSMYPEEQYAIRTLRAGASGYLTKESAPEELISAIRLGEFFGNSPQFWLNLQTKYDLLAIDLEKGAKIRAQVRASA